MTPSARPRRDAIALVRPSRAAVALPLPAVAPNPAAAAAALSVGPIHAPASPPPVPHWVVLLAVVPLFWIVVAGAVLALDRTLDRLDG